MELASFPNCPSPVIRAITPHSQTTPPRLLPRWLCSNSLSLYLPDKPRIIPAIPLVSPPPPDPALLFREKALYIESLGLDLISLVDDHPPLVSADLKTIKSTVELLQSLGFSSADLRRMFGMCPDILTMSPQLITDVLQFLLQEAGVAGKFDLRRAVGRRPRLLVSDVASQLRPTLYFLRSLGISELHKHTHLLSCSVENKLVPRIEFLEKSGFSFREARSMVRRFPQLFCYSIKENLQPKLEYLIDEMGRDLVDARQFPQYFSFSLEKRIKPRHLICKGNQVLLSLQAMLRPSDEEFDLRVEVCISSIPPSRRSPLWSHGLGVHKS